LAYALYSDGGDVELTDGNIATTGTLNSGAIVISDSSTLTFDESAADPDDADIVLSAADGVLTVGAANGANNENLTLDFDDTSDRVVFSTSTDSHIRFDEHTLMGDDVSLGFGNGSVSSRILCCINII